MGVVYGHEVNNSNAQKRRSDSAPLDPSHRELIGTNLEKTPLLEGHGKLLEEKGGLDTDRRSKYRLA